MALLSPPSSDSARRPVAGLIEAEPSDCLGGCRNRVRLRLLVPITGVSGIDNIVVLNTYSFISGQGGVEPIPVKTGRVAARRPQR
jgi:hypothetical protein